MKKVEVIKDDSVYDISVIEDNKYLAGTMIDLKRNQYYLIFPMNYDKVAADFIINNIICNISLKPFDGKKVGDIKTYSKEIIEKELENIGFTNNKNNELLNYDMINKSNDVNQAYLG